MVQSSIGSTLAGKGIVSMEFMRQCSTKMYKFVFVAPLQQRSKIVFANLCVCVCVYARVFVSVLGLLWLA